MDGLDGSFYPSSKSIRIRYIAVILPQPENLELKNCVIHPHSSLAVISGDESRGTDKLMFDQVPPGRRGERIGRIFTCPPDSAEFYDSPARAPRDQAGWRPVHRRVAQVARLLSGQWI
jgi:hypothetical protein